MFRECYEQYLEWRRRATADPDVSSEIAGMLPDVICTGSATVAPGGARSETEPQCPESLAGAFSEGLSFGTAGLRGVIGAGISRMNVYTVGRATQGLASFISARCTEGKRSAAVGYDSRIKSELFAKTAAGILAANGIKCFIYDRLMPVPCLSFAVRKLGCFSGIMITASHNPSKYNGYKVFGSDGCQITESAAGEISALISNVDCFSDVRSVSFEEGLASGMIEFIGADVTDAYIEAVAGESLIMPGDDIDRNIPIVYSPLHGTGQGPVCRILRERGFGNITVVREQSEPDGNFPTCPFPNPEIREALSLGIDYARRMNAELMLATDPDADRVGIAVREGDDYRLMTGNEVGILLTDWICARRTSLGMMPRDPEIVKTIVSTPLADKVAKSYGVKTVNVLTGFKYIGEQIADLEKKGSADSFIFGFEESYGYLAGSYVRDKDAVVASMLICEMYAFYRSEGKTLPGRLSEIYQRYGYCLNTQHSFYFEGIDGKEKMSAIMSGLRRGFAELGGIRILSVTDYLPGIDRLPPSDVIQLGLEGGSSVIVRPSGTEPKVKAYISVVAPGPEEAGDEEKRLSEAVAALMRV
ncbi:MAG: phospho-sugar mutase [Clostridia bacterium]|nr:phospho-sugar mutase [Clostridia bacterium]